METVNYATNPKEHPEPYELGLWRKWRTFGVLPEGGGQRDQLAGELDRMLYCNLTFEAVRGFNGADKKADWQAKNPGLYRAWELAMEVIHGDGN